MIRVLRNNLFKSIFALALLSILALKVFAFSISHFASSNPYSIEKNTEENKDKEEEAFDKAKKKLMLYESSVMGSEHPLWANHLPIRTKPYRLRIGNFPPKHVPTPPPDSIS